ncbi:carbohydrate kinase family protein [Myxococcota bacterium]|nr:carbohydrate kinase family protein [Myxococcota bacterium]
MKDRDQGIDRRGGTLDVAGIGSMVVDRVHRTPRILGGDAKGMLHELPGAGAVQRHVGGVVLNHLGWAAALGARVGIFGRQGDDEDGRFLQAAMDRLGIEHDLLRVDAATSLAEIFVDDAGARAIYMAPGATSGTTAAQVREHHGVFIGRARIVSTEVSQLPLGAACEALRVARGGSATCVVDLDVPPSDALASLGNEAELDQLLRSAHTLKPSKQAALELVAGSDALDIARRLRAEYANDAVVVTDGEAGCAVTSESYEGWVTGRSVTVVDTTGAGDAFLGGLLVGRGQGLGWEDAARLANACGAACAQQLGAFPEDPHAACARVAELYEGPALALAPAPPRGP